MENLWFNSWENIIKIICITPLAYIAIVIILRVSGKRTLSKMNAFDFVITIALGSVLASVAILPNIPLVEGITAFIVFIGFQFLFTWLTVRFKAFKSLITSKPSLIFYKGDFLFPIMKKERITVEEVNSAVRQNGYSSLDGIDIIILETTGDMSIIEKTTNQKETIFEDVQMK
ncbi:MAG: YetF domain-containing protein [Brumimicrobium sp.]